MRSFPRKRCGLGYNFSKDRVVGALPNGHENGGDPITTETSPGMILQVPRNSDHLDEITCLGSRIPTLTFHGLHWQGGGGNIQGTTSNLFLMCGKKRFLANMRSLLNKNRHHHFQGSNQNEGFF